MKNIVAILIVFNSALSFADDDADARKLIPWSSLRYMDSLRHAEMDEPKKEVIIFEPDTQGEYRPLLRIRDGRIQPAENYDPIRVKKLYTVIKKSADESKEVSFVRGNKGLTRGGCNWFLKSKDANYPNYVASAKGMRISEPSAEERKKFAANKKNCRLVKTEWADGPVEYHCDLPRLEAVSDLNDNGIKEYWYSYKWPGLAIEEDTGKFVATLFQREDYAISLDPTALSNYAPEEVREKIAKSIEEEQKSMCKQDEEFWAPKPTAKEKAAGS